MSFSSYRFAIKGRLNLLPTRVTAKRAGKRLANTTCRKCKEQPDTLGHVLNGCTPNASLMRERHNSILQRLSKAIPPSLGTQFLEQNVKDFPHGDLRPDLVVWHSDKKVTIIDVAIPYEGDSDAFTKARNVKRSKYQPASDSASRMATPTCLVQMKVEEPVVNQTQLLPTVKSVNVEFSKETLDTMLDGLGKTGINYLL